MKKVILNPTKSVILLLSFLVLSVTVNALPYTAVASGNWSNPATWGGIVPPFNNTLDQIIIPAGKTVTMDDNCTCNGLLASLNVLGTLNSTANKTLTLTQCTLLGTGLIDVDKMVCNTGAIMIYTGSIVANTLQCSALNLGLSANITANDQLLCSQGLLSILAGGHLSVGNGADIVITAGALALGGSSLGVSGSYNVIYNGGSCVCGDELKGSGLASVTIGVANDNTVTLNTDLVVGGTLNLNSGTLVCGGHNLTISGDVAVGGNGNIGCTPASNITVNASAGLSGILRFAGANNACNNLTINVGAASHVNIGGTLAVNGALNLTSGILDFDDCTLILNGLLNGAGSLSANAASVLTVNTAGGLATALHFAVGGQTLKDCNLNCGQGNSVLLGTDLTVQGALNLLNGCNCNTNGQTLTLGAAAVINGTGNILTNATSGLICNCTNGLSSLHLGSTIIGLLDVNCGNGSSVNLNNNLTVASILHLTNGILNLNGHDLTINGNVAVGGNGSVGCTPASNITVNAGLSGILNFAGLNNACNNFTSNCGSGNSVNIGGALAINGALNLTSGILNFSNCGLTLNGLLNGAGSLSANAASILSINTAGGLATALHFVAGGQDLKDCNLNCGPGNSVLLGTALTIHGALNLLNGCNCNTNGQTLTLGAAALISGTGSLLTNAASGLICNCSNGLSSLHLAANAVLGLLDVNCGNGNSVNLNDHLNVAGTLKLTSGLLNLNGHDLTISGNIAANLVGSIAANASSNLIINCANPPSGLLNLSVGSVLNSCTMNMGSPGAITLGSDLHIAGSLNLTNGCINTSDFGVNLGVGATVTGGNSNSYIITVGLGHIGIGVNAGTGLTLCPIGTPTVYAPCSIQPTPGSGGGIIDVHVIPDVHSNCESGDDISQNLPVVDLTWICSSNDAPNTHLTMEANWPATMEKNGFNRQNCYVTKYDNNTNKWDKIPAGSATSGIGGLFKMLRLDVSLGCISVFDGSIITATTELTDAQFKVYPSLAKDYINVSNTGITNEVTNIDIVNLNGQVVKTTKMSSDNEELSLAGLSPGNYVVRINNSGTTEVKKFIKQ